MKVSPKFFSTGITSFFWKALLVWAFHLFSVWWMAYGFMSWIYIVPPPEQEMIEYAWAFILCSSFLTFACSYWTMYDKSPEWHGDMRRAILDAAKEEGIV